MEKVQNKSPNKNKFFSEDDEEEEEEVVEIDSGTPSPASSDGEAEERPERRGEDGEVPKKKPAKRKSAADRQTKIKDFFNEIKFDKDDVKKKTPKRRSLGKRAGDPEEIMRAEQDFAVALTKYSRMMGKKCQLTLNLT